MQQQQATSNGEDSRKQPATRDRMRCRNCGNPWHGSQPCVLVPAAVPSKDTCCPAHPNCHQPVAGALVPAALRPEVDR